LVDRKVAQLHWGGGTPTHLNPDEIADLASYIKESFNFKETSENSCEIDPRGLTKEHLEALRFNGFNRISMGVQDFNEKVQKAVNRIQPEDITRQATLILSTGSPSRQLNHLLIQSTGLLTFLPTVLPCLTMPMFPG
jgi:coproporphyrinogen III oxidase-like Fe-S oxidoreductase